MRLRLCVKDEVEADFGEIVEFYCFVFMKMKILRKVLT